MATYSYKHYTYSKTYPCATWYAEVTESEVNANNNTSKITIKFYVKATHNGTRSDTYNNYPAGYGSSTPYAKIYVDGSCVKTVNPACFDVRYNSAKKIKNGTVYDLGTYTKTITHASDGSKKLTIKCQHYTSVSPGYATVEGTFTCQKIDVHRRTYLTVPSGTHNIGSSITIQANPKSTNYTHALNVSLDNSNWTEIQKSLKFGTANSNNNYKFTIPTAFKNSIAKQKTGTMYIKLSTWISGEYIGVETKTVTIKNNDQDLRATYLTVPSGTHNIGSDITVQANPCNTSLKHNLWVSDDNENWIQLKEGFTLSNANTNNSITFKIPNEYTEKIPAKSSGTMWVWLATFNNGTRIGYENKTVKIYNNNEKTNGTFEFSSTMKNSNGKYLFSDNKKLITDLNVTWDYMPYSVVYEITGPNGYSYSKTYSVDYERGSADNSGDKYILWKDQSQGSGYHKYTSPTLPTAGSYTIKVQVKDGRQTTTGGPSPQFTKSISINLENPSLTINSLAIDNGFTYVSDGKYIINKSNPKADVTFYTESKIKSIIFELTGANNASVSVSSTELNSLAACKTHKVSGMLGVLSKAGTNTLKVTVNTVSGQTASKIITFQSYEENKYLSIQDSYIDNTLARDLINDKYYIGKSRLGLRIKITHSHTLKSLTLKIGSMSYDLKSYMYNNASYTCPDILTQSGDVKIQLTVTDINGLTDTKTMTVFVNEDNAAPKCPVIRFEHKHPRRPHRHFYFCEGEHVVFTGSSPNIEDYQIIYALGPCDVFSAFSKFNSENSYADADSDELSDRLEEFASDDLDYYIWKDFGEGEYSRPICKHPTEKFTFRLYEVAPDHDAHEEYFALQWFEHAEPGDVLYLYVRERKKKVTSTAASEEYLYCDAYEYNKIPKEKLFPMCVLPPMPSQIQLYEKSRDNKKMIIEYINPIYSEDMGVKNPIHLIDVCLIAKNKNGQIINGDENKKRDGKHGRSWVYYSDRKWHSIVPWKYTQTNNKERFTMEFDVSQYGTDAIIYVVAFYYNDFYRHPSIYSTSNVLQSQGKDMEFNLAFEKPENNSSVNSPNPLVQVKLLPTITDEDALMESIYSDINFCKHWHKHRHHWHKCPIWLHHWPRKHDRCFPHFHIHNLYKPNCFYDHFDDCPRHRIEHHWHHKHHYHHHHKCWKIPDKQDVDSTVSYNECCLFLSCGDKEINLGDINIDELQNEERLFEWIQDANDTFLKPGANKISAYTYPYNYKGETKNEIEAPHGHWHSRCNFICHPIMKCHPPCYRDIIIRPKHILNWLDIEKDIIRFKIPYRRLIPNHEYVLIFKSFTDYGFLYPHDKVYEVPYKKDEDDDLICGAYLDMVVHHDSILVNLDYENRFVIYRPCYHIIDKHLHRPCINHYKKEIIHTIKFKAPAKTSHFPWDRFFDIVIKARGVHKIKIFGSILKDVTGKTEEDLTVERTLNKTKKEHEVSINVNYDFKLELKDINYINPLSSKDQMSLRNYLLNIASECGITNVQPSWRNYNTLSYLMARDYNDLKEYCYNLFTAIKNKYSNTFKGDPNLFNNLPTIVVGDKRGPNTFSARGMHYFPEWDDLIDAIKKQQFGIYEPSVPSVPTEPSVIKCTGINIIPDRIPIPQNGSIGDQYHVDYEVFPSNCMEEVVWVMESTKYLNVNDAIMKRTVDNIENNFETKVVAKCGSYSDSAAVYSQVSESTVMHKIKYYLAGGVASDTRQEVKHNDSFRTVVTATGIHSFGTAKVTMGGRDVTASYVTITTKEVIVSIPAVTGDLYIDARVKNPTESPTITTPQKYPCTGLSVGGSITLKEGAISIGTNITGTIGYMYPTYTPANCTDSPSVSSSNSSVAEAACTNFINGKITVRVAGYKAGSCTITIRMGNYSGSFSVTVTK